MEEVYSLLKKGKSTQRFLYNKDGYLMTPSEESELLTSAVGVRVSSVKAVCTVSQSTDVTTQSYPTMSSEFMGKSYGFWAGCPEGRTLLPSFRIMSPGEVTIVHPACGDIARLDTIIQYPCGWPGWIMRMADLATLQMGNVLVAQTVLSDGDVWTWPREGIEKAITQIAGIKEKITLEELTSQIKAHISGGSLRYEEVFNRIPVEVR